MLSVGKLAQLAHIFETNEGPTSDDMMDSESQRHTTYASSSLTLIAPQRSTTT